MKTTNSSTPIRQAMGVFLLFIIVLIFPISNIEAQPPLEPVYKGLGLGWMSQLQWSSDSMSLSFRSAAGEHLQDGWFVYDVATQQLNAVPGNPSLPPISPAQADALGLPSYQTAFFFTSPNGRYVVYDAPASAGTWKDGRSLIALSDLQTNETTIINLPLDFWYARWSEDSSAFFIETTLTYAGTTQFYFRNFAASVSNVESIVLWDVVQVDDHPVGLSRIYDLSSDGKKILLASGSRMAIWDTTQPPTITSFASIPVAEGAAFSADDQQVLFVTKTGMFRYNLNTQETSPLGLVRGTELLERATSVLISPDGKWVAIIYGPVDFSNPELYILETALALP